MSPRPEPDAAEPVQPPPDAAPPKAWDATAPSADTGGGGEPDAAPAPATCDETRPRRPGLAILPVTVELTLGGKPLTFGQPFPLPAGNLTLTSFRFYLADVALLRGDQAVPADLVAADGAPVPYNLHLVTADEPAGMTFRLAAPAGEGYTGLSFLFGLSPACDQMNPSTSKPPLTSSSQMDWPGPFGYLFLRYGARYQGVTEAERGPELIHMGGFPGLVFAPRVTAPGPVRVAGGQAPRLRVDVAEIIRAARMPAMNEGPIAPPTGGGVGEGDALRQHAGEVSIFSVSPGP